MAWSWCRYLVVEVGSIGPGGMGVCGAGGDENGLWVWSGDYARDCELRWKLSSREDRKRLIPEYAGGGGIAGIGEQVWTLRYARKRPGVVRG